MAGVKRTGANAAIANAAPAAKAPTKKAASKRAANAAPANAAAAPAPAAARPPSRRAAGPAAAPGSKRAGAANAAAAAGSKKANAAPAPREHKLDDEVYGCRIKKYTEYRGTCQAQKAKQDKGEGKVEDAACKAVLDRCGRYGVGSSVWPVDFWPKGKDDKESADKLQAIRDADPNFHFGKGRRCMTDVFWEINGDELLKCGGEKPGFLAAAAGRSKKGGVSRNAGAAPRSKKGAAGLLQGLLGPAAA